MSNGTVQRYNLWVPIVPSDTVNISVDQGIGENDLPTDAIWVGGAGIVVAVMQNGRVVNFTCTAGTLLPIAAIRVQAAATTATLLVALFQR